MQKSRIQSPRSVERWFVSTMAGIVCAAAFVSVAVAQDTAPIPPPAPPVPDNVAPPPPSDQTGEPATTRRRSDRNDPLSRLTLAEQRVLGQAMQKLNPEERRIFLKALNVKNGSGFPTSPTPTIPPTNPTVPGSSGTGTGDGTGTPQPQSVPPAPMPQG